MDLKYAHMNNNFKTLLFSACVIYCICVIKFFDLKQVLFNNNYKMEKNKELDLTKESFENNDMK